MSSFNLGKKLNPANKAWKSLTKTLRSKLETVFNVSQPLKIITTRSLKSVRSIRRYVNLRRSSKHQCQRHFRSTSHLQRRSGAIYVDELFDRHQPLRADHQVTLKRRTSTSTSENDNPSTGDKSLNPKQKELEIIHETNPATLADAWKNIALSSLPKPQGIDEKAEDFISKFREDMKMQKEKSFLDFQEMLARSS